MECCAGERRHLIFFLLFWDENLSIFGLIVCFFQLFFFSLSSWVGDFVFAGLNIFFCLSDSHLTNSNGYIYIAIYFLFFLLCFGLKQEIYIHIIKYVDLLFSVCFIVLLKETYVIFAYLLFRMYFFYI